MKKARYYHRDVDVCGKVVGMRKDGAESFLEIEASGTQDEELLRSLSGIPGRKLTVHVCPDGCGEVLSGANVVHGKDYEEVDVDKEAWMSNLKEVISAEATEDENAKLREELERYRAEREREESPKKKKKKKEKEREEREEKERRRAGKR